MTPPVREGELEFEFSGAARVERLDQQGIPLPQGMQLVDFVVEEQHRTLLIEVKDPSQSAVPERERRSFAKKMRQNTLIHQELVPKARDSYTYLHLMANDSKPFLFVVVLGLEELPDQVALLAPFKDRLLGRLRHEAEEPWLRQYVTDCIVVTPDLWSTHFPDYALTRK